MILVTGAKGQLGSDVSAELTKRSIPHIPTDADTLDITDKAAVEKFFSDNKISSVIHCAAYTAVDKAESEEELCFKINAEGTENLAEASAKSNAKMLYVSTDYVFQGDGEKPFEVYDKKNPQNIYGKSKLLGEEAVKKHSDKYFIVRTSWVFGEKNTNFIHTMLRLSETRDEVSVVCDQIGSPTYTYDLARLLVDMIQTDKYGRYHATNEGLCSWYEFAVEIFKQAGMDEVKVTPVTTAEYTAMYPNQAKRPMNSRISKEKLSENGFERLPSWQDALGRYLKEIQ